MQSYGIDFSWGRPSIAQLKAANVGFVGRYAAAGRASINISKDEAAAYKVAGVNLYIYNEHTAGYMMGGRQVGITAASGALTVTRAAAIPDGVVYFSADFQATIGQMGTLESFLNGAADIVGAENVGIYGSYDVCKWVLDHTPYKHAAQCAAWSKGKWDPRVEIRQDKYDLHLGGVPIDGNTLIRDGGQFRLTAFPPPPVIVSHTSVVDIAGIQSAVHATADGVWGPDTDRRLEAVRATRTVLARSHPDLVRSAQRTLAVIVDGVWGPLTASAWTRCVQTVQRALHLPADGLWGPATDATYVAASPYR